MENIQRRTHKIGINSPIYHWFKKDLKDWSLDILNSKNVTESAILGDYLIGEKLAEGYRSNKLTHELIRAAWQEINLQLISKN
jgi:hypothetical protein